MKSGAAFRSLAKRMTRGVLGSLLQRHPPHPRVLMYHSIDDSGSVLSVTCEQLRWHLRILRELGFRGLSLDEFCGRAVAGELAGAKPEVLLTFDDGYQNFSDCAVPLLLEFGFPATVFIVPAFMGGLPRWYQRDSHIASELVAQLAVEPAEIAELLRRINELADMPLMSWAEATAVAQRGFDVASHSYEHRRLTDLSQSELIRDLSMSRDIISTHLGTVPDLLCYPYGACDANVISAAREAGFRAGVLASAACSNDEFRLNRTGVGSSTTLNEFRYLISRAADLEWRIRRMLKDYSVSVR